MIEIKNTSRVFVCADIHGGFRALKQCLKRSHFNYEKDKLICLGDVVDGWPETPQCIEELLKIKNLVYVMGNHDQWCHNWFQWGDRPIIWTEQGGQATIDAYIKNGDLLVKHRDFFMSKIYGYYIDDKNRIFVHGGFYLDRPIKEMLPEDLMWDRTLFEKARFNKEKYSDYDEIFLGHTSTWSFSHLPFKAGNVWFMDQGGGWEGKLSIMNVDTKKFFQSDRVCELYPEERGRN